MKRTSSLAVQAMNQLLWPSVCSNCRESICNEYGKLCSKCWSELTSCTSGDYCRRCGRDADKTSILYGLCPNCQGEEMNFDGIARGGLYQKCLRRMIVDFKNGATVLNSILASLADSALQGSVFQDQIELFVPVPLHWTRRFIRGYNQSALLIRKLAYARAKTSTDLVRIRSTKLQTTMASASARARNVAGAFAVRPGHDFANRNVCLIDDIKTTGATLNECAKILKQAGAAKVFALVLAVAGQDSSKTTF
jgi:competence protein ComFC